MSVLSSMPVLPAEAVPLRWDDGVWRVGSTNLTLEAVVELFESGLEADEIAREFDGLELASVYQIIGYYLRHRETLAAYLAERRSHLTGRRKRGKATAREMRERLQARR